MTTKICNKGDCKSEGAEQSIDNFIVVTANTGGYSHVCKECVASIRVLSNNQNDIQVLPNDHYIVNHIKYKILNGRFLMIRILDEWVRSSNDVEWLQRKVARYA